MDANQVREATGRARRRLIDAIANLRHASQEASEMGNGYVRVPIDQAIEQAEEGLRRCHHG